MVIGSGSMPLPKETVAVAEEYVALYSGSPDLKPVSVEVVTVVAYGFFSYEYASPVNKVVNASDVMVPAELTYVPRDGLLLIWTHIRLFASCVVRSPRLLMVMRSVSVHVRTDQETGPLFIFHENREIWEVTQSSVSQAQLTSQRPKFWLQIHTPSSVLYNVGIVSVLVVEMSELVIGYVVDDKPDEPAETQESEPRKTTRRRRRG